MFNKKKKLAVRYFKLASYRSEHRLKIVSRSSQDRLKIVSRRSRDHLRIILSKENFIFIFIDSITHDILILFDLTITSLDSTRLLSHISERYYISVERKDKLR